MFEKEAEEWVKENMDCCKTDNSVNQSIPYFDEEERCVAKSAFQDGAEFGYNKANEWHYVKSEEDLPKDNSEYLLLLEHGIRVFGYYNGKWWESWKGDLSWQEVKAYFFVPVPELKESE